MKTTRTQDKTQKGVKYLAVKFNRSKGHISRILKGERPAEPIKGLPQAIRQLKQTGVWFLFLAEYAIMT